MPKLGSLVEITWLDAVGYIGATQDEAVPSTCITIGRLVTVRRRSLVIATSLYEDGSGDFTVLPKSMLLKVKTIPHQPAQAPSP
jgi:hypothetical protein